MMAKVHMMLPPEISIFGILLVNNYTRVQPQLYYRNDNAAFVFFDVTNQTTFLASESWIQDLQEGNDDLFIILVGNKIDLLDQRSVDIKDAESLAKKYNLPYIETSALNGTGIDQAFQTIIMQIKVDNTLKRKLNLPIDPTLEKKVKDDHKDHSCC